MLYCLLCCPRACPYITLHLRDTAGAAQRQRGTVLAQQAWPHLANAFVKGSANMKRCKNAKRLLKSGLEDLLSQHSLPSNHWGLK